MQNSGYERLKALKRNHFDVVALYHRLPEDDFGYVLFTFGSEASIKSFLPTCNGQAVRVKLKAQRLWVLLDGDSNRMLVFRATDEPNGFTDIAEEDLPEVQYLCSL
jgi:hypothetical protein